MVFYFGPPLEGYRSLEKGPSQNYTFLPDLFLLALCFFLREGGKKYKIIGFICILFPAFLASFILREAGEYEGNQKGNEEKETANQLAVDILAGPPKGDLIRM